jgi:hypothetical protein
VDDLVAAAEPSALTQMAGSIALSEQVQNRLDADGPPSSHTHDTPPSQPSQAQGDHRHTADDLGWG